MPFRLLLYVVEIRKGHIIKKNQNYLSNYELVVPRTNKQYINKTENIFAVPIPNKQCIRKFSPDFLCKCLLLNFKRESNLNRTIDFFLLRLL